MIDLRLPSDRPGEGRTTLLSQAQGRLVRCPSSCANGFCPFWGAAGDTGGDDACEHAVLHEYRPHECSGECGDNIHAFPCAEGDSYEESDDLELPPTQATIPRTLDALKKYAQQAGQEEGVCPRCGSEDLEYSDSERVDSSYRYDLACNACDFEGYEWYDLEFAGFTDLDGNEVVAVNGEELPPTQASSFRKGDQVVQAGMPDSDPRKGRVIGFDFSDGSIMVRWGYNADGTEMIGMYSRDEADRELRKVSSMSKSAQFDIWDNVVVQHEFLGSLTPHVQGSIIVEKGERGSIVAEDRGGFIIYFDDQDKAVHVAYSKMRYLFGEGDPEESTLDMPPTQASVGKISELLVQRAWMDVPIGAPIIHPFHGRGVKTSYYYGVFDGVERPCFDGTVYVDMIVDSSIAPATLSLPSTQAAAPSWNMPGTDTFVDNAMFNIHNHSGKTSFPYDLLLRFGFELQYGWSGPLETLIRDLSKIVNSEAEFNLMMYTAEERANTELLTMFPWDVTGKSMSAQWLKKKYEEA